LDVRVAPRLELLAASATTVRSAPTAMPPTTTNTTWTTSDRASTPARIPIARSNVSALAFWTVRIKKNNPATTATTKKHKNTTAPKDCETLATPGDSL